MRKGYVMLDPSNKYRKDDMEKIQSAKCDTIFIDNIEDEETRPQWNHMMNGLKKGDELVVISLCNAVRGLRNLSTLFDRCRVLKVRLISLRDRIDSWEEMYPACVSQLMDVIATLQGDILNFRHSNKTARIKRVVSSGNRTIRAQRCVALYKSGASIDEIKKETGFNSSSSIYRVVKEAGEKLDRRTNKKKPI